MPNLSVFQFIIRVTPLDRPQRDEKGDTFQGSEGSIYEDELNVTIYLIVSGFAKSLTSSISAAM